MNQVFKGVVFVVVDGDELDVDVLRDYLTNAVAVDLDTEEHGQPAGAEVVAVGLNWEELKRVTEKLTLQDVAREFIEDVRVVGGLEYLKRKWPDLAVTYQKMLSVLD